MTVAVASPYQRLESELQAWLGTDAAVAGSGVDGEPSRLWPQEREAVARAVTRRQREFAAGRSNARAAMKSLGWPAAAIPAHPDRSPCWPRGLVGSIAHCSDTCVAVVGEQRRWTSIGVDIEPDRGIDNTLWELVCGPDELRQLKQLDSMDPGLFAARVFVAKEAFYKWHFPQHRTFLDFHDVSLSWSVGAPGFQVDLRVPGVQVSADTGRGRFFVVDGALVACYASRAGTGVGANPALLRQ